MDEKLVHSNLSASSSARKAVAATSFTADVHVGTRLGIPSDAQLFFILGKSFILQGDPLE